LLNQNAAPFPPIKWVGFDVDGVMTDGGIYLDDNGLETKRFNSRDGHGLKMLIKQGFTTAIVTGRKSRVTEHRFLELGFAPSRIYQGVFDKGQLFEQILERENLQPEQTAFAGDDIVDLPVMLRCGLPMAPCDACPEALAAARFVSRSPGGGGAVREMAEYILKNLGFWNGLLRRYQP
jgi:3-deoxy-D-manno-octulosonate 8-phosphate phosphatase (KDO 8-P phosphatase)